MIRCLLAALLALPPLTAAAEPPACERPAMGAVACLAGRLCECVYDRGGLMTGTPAGYRWECGILRPRCGDAAVPAGEITEHRGAAPALPLAVGIDRSDRSITVGD